ncbi:MAG: integrin alpha [Patescibacteria group bacterium]
MMKKILLALLLTLPSSALAQDVYSLSTFQEYTGEVTSDYAGEHLSSAGDFNGDGYDDILIAAQGNSDAAIGAGAVYLIYGQANHLVSASLSTAVEFTGEAENDAAGRSVASAGDVNNDGFDDILIGAYRNGDADIGAGAAYLIYGQATPLSGVISLSTAAEFTGEAANDAAGRAVASAGDVNNDGFDDILIGADGNNDADVGAGAVYLIYGQSTPFAGTSSLSTAVEFTGEVTGNNDNAGRSVASAGDVNNDGFDDILIGADRNSDADASAGAVYLIYGQSTPFTGTSSLSTAVEFTGETAGDSAGISVSPAGDINNDGFDDILIGANGNSDVDVNTGAAYLGYLYLDEDSNSIVDPSGVFAGATIIDYDTDNDGSYVGQDCNDNDATVSINQTYYRDNDQDGLGDLATTTAVCLSIAPAGYVNNSTDTNDTDYDNDGSITSTDCNDADATVHSNQTYYRDADLDGLGDLATTSVVCSMTVTAGYVTNSTDTNDTDYDNDGSITSTDCNDADATIHENQTYYRDEDNDSLGDPNDTISICSFTTPDGYVINGNETNDTGSVAYVLGTNTGPGIISLYDSNDVRIRQWVAFTKGGVLARLVDIKNTNYVLALKKKSGSTIHMYDTTGTVLKKQRLSPKLHWRQPAIGNLNNSTNTEEFVISAKRASTLYLRVYNFNTQNNTFNLLQQTTYHYIRHSYRVEVRNKTVVVKINGAGKTVLSWKPFGN